MRPTTRPTRSRRRHATVLALALATAAISGCGTSATDEGPGPGAGRQTRGDSGATDPSASPSGPETGRGGRPAPTEPVNPATSTTPRVLPGTARPGRYQAPERQPNILLITVDDMAQGDLRYMPQVRRAIGRQGTTFQNAVAPTPICVPARASLLTGQYAHNHGALTIFGQGGGFNAFKDDDQTLPVWLQDVGYDTMFVGKYLNGYGMGIKGESYVPPGWSQWRGSLDPTTYYFPRARQNIDGRVRVTERYNTDVFAGDVDEMLADPARRKAPWYLWVNYVGPHHGTPVESDDPQRTHPTQPRSPNTTVPAPEDRNTFRGLRLPRKPDLFERDVSDKPRASPARVRTFSKLDRALAREEYQQRIEALQSVDRAVGRHLALLRRTGQLRDTLVAFTSDNGFAIGEHNIEGKLWGYRETAGITMLMRGPGIPKNRKRQVMVTNPDLPVSFAAAAGATPTRDVDGVNVLDRLGRDPGRRVVPIEAYPVSGSTREPLYTGVRVGPWTYVRYRGGGEEVYQHRRDPYELDNLIRAPRVRTQVNELRRLARTYRDCAGTTCPQQFYR